MVEIITEPTALTVKRYTEPSFLVKAIYEDASSRYVSGYSVNGFNKAIIGVQNATVQYIENSIIKNMNIAITVTPMKRTCPECGYEYNLDAKDFDLGCPVCKLTMVSIRVSPIYLTVLKNQPLDIVVTATYKDGHTGEVTGWNSNYEPNRVGNQLVMITFNGMYTFVSVTVVDEKDCDICGTAYALNEDGTDPGCPICKEYLVSISATPENQTIEKGEELSLTVTGIYRDGHSNTLTGWGSSFDKNLMGEQTVTVYYNNKTCTVLVNVVSEEEVQCSICGAFYNFSENPHGCPICAGTITRIEVSLLSGGVKTTYGQPLELAVVLVYRDGHREMVYDGWQDNFDSHVLGEQVVTIGYTDKYNNVTNFLLTVEVVDKLTQTVCGNGHVYYDDGGSCPYCAAISGDGISLYSSCNFTEEILEDLYENGVYDFAEGDYVTVKVNIRTEGSIYSMGLFRKNEGITTISYGGEVA